MINVPRALAALDAIEGEQVVLSKAQYGEIMGEVARGNAARMTLINARSVMTAGALAAGIN
jgi:hypothetical protein